MLFVDEPRIRRAIRIHGTVQGVGLRPSVHRTATRLGLGGFVRNERSSVLIEIEGTRRAIDRFASELMTILPDGASIDRIETAERPLRQQRSFQIAKSELGAPCAGIPIPPDLAPCPSCLRELGSPADRRYRYPFINCTLCGPRFTISDGSPYDRDRTTMAPFVFCPRCRREYEDPTDRRFHAEPNACPECGPRLALFIAKSERASGDAALSSSCALLLHGAIVAMKGVGGFLLATDATDDHAVSRLRALKHRPHRPFAVMARDLETAALAAEIDDAARDALLSPQRPIVLLPSRGIVSSEIAPSLREIGLFLPPSPLQHLLAAGGPSLQVMTSGNLSGEPIIIDDEEALDRLSPIVDAVLIHNREIRARADDSVMRPIAGSMVPLRRARGFVPAWIPLDRSGPPILAVGGQMKSTVCLAWGGRAVLSAHLGELSDARAFACFEEAIDQLVRLAGVRPTAIAHDLHPDYRSTRWALASGLPRIPVQHHHAHVAACIAEHQKAGPLIGVAFDGTGFGEDGGIWGGEILEADLERFTRLGHLSPLPLLGGARAIREVWRLGLAALLEAGEPLDPIARGREARVEALRRLPAGSAPRTTSAGRWFDAIAALTGTCSEISYDGQAAAELEACAAPGLHEPYEIEIGGDLVIDLVPAIRAIARDLRQEVERAIISARFHETMARAVLLACREIGSGSRVALTGGCFANRLLTERTRALLEADGFEVLLHRRVPPNDGGLAFGQAAIASHRTR